MHREAFGDLVPDAQLHARRAGRGVVVCRAEDEDARFGKRAPQLERLRQGGDAHGGRALLERDAGAVEGAVAV